MSQNENRGYTHSVGSIQGEQGKSSHDQLPNSATSALQQVRIDDFDLPTLKQAAREGRLFLQPANDTRKDERTSHLEAILQYVSRIDNYATPDFRNHITDLWKAILYDEQLQPLFFFNRYGATRNQPNWYRVTAIVCLLREEGIYRSDVTALQLHLILENTTRRTNRYNGMARYRLDYPQMLRVRRIIRPTR